MLSRTIGGDFRDSFECWTIDCCKASCGWFHDSYSKSRSEAAQVMENESKKQEERGECIVCIVCGGPMLYHPLPVCDLCLPQWVGGVREHAALCELVGKEKGI